MPARRRHDKRRLSRERAFLIALAVLALLAAVYLVSQYLDEQRLQPEPTGDPGARHTYDQTLEYGGHTYRQKSAVTSILLMGIDADESAQVSVGQRGKGQADFLRLIVIDRSTHILSQVAIDRDTMAEITILGVTGNVSGTRVDNISLSHSFGDGGERSCELTRQAVSRLLSGTRIDFYMSMNMNGIGALNDALGGVTVTIEEDMTGVSPTWTAGSTVTLHGAEAERFVRSRTSVGDGTNVSRMRRQQQFISGALSLMEARTRQDADTVGQVFDAIFPYLVSGINRDRLVSIAYEAQDFERPALYSIPGEHVISEEGFMQFWPDEDALTELTLSLFYTQID